MLGLLFGRCAFCRFCTCYNTVTGYVDCLPVALMTMLWSFLGCIAHRYRLGCSTNSSVVAARFVALLIAQDSTLPQVLALYALSLPQDCKKPLMQLLPSSPKGVPLRAHQALRMQCVCMQRQTHRRQLTAWLVRLRSWCLTRREAWATGREGVDGFEQLCVLSPLAPIGAGQCSVASVHC